MKLNCDKCSMPFQNRWDKQNIRLFHCGHNFHARCTVNGNCAICFNDHDEISKSTSNF